MRKNPINKKGYGWIAMLLLLASCFKTNQSVNPARSSILQFIAQTPSLHLLNAAVNRVQLDTAMTSGGPFTFFAPSDSAFLAAGLTLDSINRMDPLTLSLMLRYQLVNGRISADALPGFLKQPFTSLHPLYQPFITKSYYGIFINGIGVVNGNNVAGDGIVQVTDRIAFPPVGSQLQAMQSSPDMTFFAALVNHVYVFSLLVANPDPYSYYNGFSSYQSQIPTFGNTLLVPTDSAFRAFGYPDSASLYNDSMNVIYGYYDQNSLYHQPLVSAWLFSGFIFTADLRGELPSGISPLAFINPNISSYVHFTTSLDGRSLTGNGIAPGSPVKIIGPDIIATNGVIQKINQVFISH